MVLNAIKQGGVIEDEYSLKNEYNTESGSIRIFLEIEKEEVNLLEGENGFFNSNHILRRKPNDDYNHFDGSNDKRDETINDTINYPSFLSNKLTLENYNPIITHSVLDDPKETTLCSLDITKKIFCHNQKLYEL